MGEVDAQIERGAGARHVEQSGRQTRRVEGDLALVLVLHHHLEQRIAARVATRVERAHQLVEGDAPVFVRRGAALADPVQQGREVRVSGEVQAQRHGVEEQAHMVLGAGGTRGDRGTDHHVPLPAEPAEDRTDRAGQRHEEGGALPGRERPQPAGQFGVEGVREARARSRPDRRTGPVGGQGQLRCAAESPPPEVERRGIRHGGRRRFGQRPRFGQGTRCGTSAPPGAVVRGQVADQDGRGRRVEDDVVRHEEEQVVVRGQPEQAGRDQRARGEVESVVRRERRP